MKFKKFLVFIVFFVSFISTSVFAKWHFVSAKLDEGIFMVPYYHVTHTNLDYDNGVAFIVVHTQGDCRTQPVQRCRNHSPGYGHTPSWRECWVEYEVSCNHQTGYYPLPTDAVIFDGGTRLKFVQDGQYQTIARWDRFPLFPFVRHLNVRRENARIGVSQDLKEATLFVETDH